jgi:hypothetical protein
MADQTDTTTRPRYTIAEYAAMPAWRRNFERRYSSDCPLDEDLLAHPWIVERKGRKPIVQSVYFIQAGTDGPIKIGMTHELKKRLGAMQVANHEELTVLLFTPGGAAVEQWMHYKYRAHCIRGEWFKPHPDLLAEIAKLKVMTDAQT